jgi:hypothetical protein
MIEILAIATLLLLIGFIGAAVWAFRRLRVTIDTLGVALAITDAKTIREFGDLGQVAMEGNSLLREAIANLPKKGKPGRKPSASTGAKRGPKPKTAPAGVEPAAPAPSGALLPFPPPAETTQ